MEREMKKILNVILIIICSLSIYSCRNSREVKVIKEEVFDFDLTTAAKMIEDKERLIVEVSLKKRVTPTEFEEIKNTFTEEFGEHAENILSIFFGSGVQSEVKTDMYIEQNTFYPTAFHKGIDIKSASIHNIYYEYEAFNTSYLEITEKYRGEDKMMEEWERTYIFRKDEEGQWGLYTFSGTMNFAGEGFNAKYLEFK
jgi:hypothetical protein